MAVESYSVSQLELSVAAESYSVSQLELSVAVESLSVRPMRSQSVEVVSGC